MMTTNECKAVRREIDQTDLAGQLTTEASDHLLGCAECRTFEAEQRSLQGLMASLDKVAAPSDFDFRLRARLAREKGRPRRDVGISSFAIIPRSIAAVALVMLIAVAGIVVKNWLASRNASTSNAVNGSARVGDASPKETGTTSPISPVRPRKENVPGMASKQNEVGRDNVTQRRAPAPQKINAPSSGLAVARKGKGTATVEFGVSPAPVLESDQKPDPGTVVLVSLDTRALKISIDNGRGTSRTISLPTVSFGSQRLMARDSFQPVSSAKGVW